MDHKNSLQTRLREHVKKRGNPTIPNGAWDMMLEAADRIDDLEAEVKDLREEIKDIGWRLSYNRDMSSL